MSLFLLCAPLVENDSRLALTIATCKRGPALHDLAFRILLTAPVALWAGALVWFPERSGVGSEPRAETRAVMPFGGDTTGAPVLVGARVVCSLADENRATASIKEFDGGSSVLADGRSYWVFGDAWLQSGGGRYVFANALVAESADDDASDCVSLSFKTSDSLPEPLFPLREGETTAWPDGAVAVEPGRVDFYFASVERTSPSEWHVESVGVGQFDTESMNGQRLVEDLWDASSGFGDVVNGARSPVLQSDDVFVFLHTTGNRHLLARVPADSMASASAYSYWDGVGWSRFPADAKALWPEPTTGLPTHDGLSVRYNSFLGKWLALYNRDLSTISARVSDRLTGSWSNELELLDCKNVFASAVWPFCYYAEQHWESERDGGRTVYVTVSTAPPYDVYLLELRLGAAIHQWRDGAGGVIYSPVRPGDEYTDEGVCFYASDTPVPGFFTVRLWETEEGERVYSSQRPGPAFTARQVAFFAPAYSQVPNSMVRYAPVYRWDRNRSYLYSAASDGLERLGYVRGPVAFYAVCGDTDLDGVGDCLQ